MGNSFLELTPTIARALLVPLLFLLIVSNGVDLEKTVQARKNRNISSLNVTSTDQKLLI